ncbi:MAG: serine/threonine protein kinase [Frankiales bacterium]|nr:serine/threonine protein kinase [Frankiales bacterium]
MATASGPGTTPARGSLPPVLGPGDLLADRYRLVQQVSPGSVPVGAPAELWLATDEILARPVAVKVLPARGQPGTALAKAFLDAAGRAGALSHPGLARVYDAALEQRPTARADRAAEVAYVVSEWFPDRTLADVLRTEGPLAPAEAVRLAHQAAEALAAAHARGFGHGRLHPGNLFVSGGRLRLTDAALAAVLHGDALPAPGPDGAAAPGVVRADTRDLGAVLYAMLTARWPAGSTALPAAGLPEAPRAAGRSGVYAPRQVRAGVPRSLDTVVSRVLDPARHPQLAAISTPAALARALDETAPELPPAPATPSRRRQAPRVLRALPKVVALGVIVAVGLGCYLLGRQIGELPRQPGALDALVQPTPSVTAPGATLLAPISLTTAPVVVRDYDPAGDGTEQSGSVPNAVDGDLSTSWMTDGYATPAFGGLKSGVGLLVDLGTPGSVQSVKVGLAAAGADLELRTTDILGAGADDFTVVARSTGAEHVATLTPSVPTRARYWLVWFTKLPRAADGRYRDGIAELVFTRSQA